MRILAARAPATDRGGGKEQSAVQNSELDHNGTTNGSHDQDALDMQKLGLRQQTKVSATATPTEPSRRN
jgi:hypothetical protein